MDRGPSEKIRNRNNRLLELRSQQNCNSVLNGHTKERKEGKTKQEQERKKAKRMTERKKVERNKERMKERLGHLV